jgi:HEAT repeat protein
MHRGDESIIPDLDKALRASNEDQVREDIVEVLATIPRCPQLQTTLLGYLHHALSSVRRRAIVALGDIGDEKAIFYLNEVAREGDQTEHWLTPEDSRLAREAVQKIRERTG